MSMIRYIVTDPCYLLNYEQWDECCKFLDDGFEKFNAEIAKILTDITKSKSWVCDTGFGDWSNELFGCNIIKSDFYADAGMVCICKLTPEILNYWMKKYNTTKLSGAAIFEMSENISVEFDQSYKDWTVITIKDNVYGDVIKSMEDDTFYNDEED